MLFNMLGIVKSVLLIYFCWITRECKPDFGLCTFQFWQLLSFFFLLRFSSESVCLRILAGSKTIWGDRHPHLLVRSIMFQPYLGRESQMTRHFFTLETWSPRCNVSFQWQEKLAADLARAQAKLKDYEEEALFEFWGNDGGEGGIIRKKKHCKLIYVYIYIICIHTPTHLQ